MSAFARTFTPDREEITEDGRTVTHLHLKRCCNGCGVALGDVENRDVDAKGNLTDVRGECPNCRPLVEAEAAGCRTWHLLPRDLSENRFAVLRKLATPYREPDESGRPAFRGLTLPGGADGDRPIARFGDWIIRHPDGRWSVHAGPATDGSAA